MNLLAQQGEDELPRPGLLDNEVLDQFEVPVGEWADQSVDWITVNLEWLLRIIEWPFDTLIGFLVGDVLVPAPWILVVVAFFVIGTLVRNLKVGTFAVVSLGLCAILGNNFWLQTARTIGYVGVAVLLCVIVGIPLGVACGRVDGVWRVMRPVLDGMQVIHSFVYMLPFIFFWGIGPVSATMVTMVFALPPLVRLTNLGVRQVPSDVVEASRAYGAPEWRVLVDVQLPLARAAIATGINQTLLLAISMLGIAAIMGAGGLGLVLLQAMNGQKLERGAASGLAFFLVAVVLDRISQPGDAHSPSLLRRIRLAWTQRRTPEALLAARERQPVGDATAEEAVVGRFAEVSNAERSNMLLAAAGGLLAIVSAFLTWTADAGFMSAYGRRSDESLVGQSFNGLSSSGGSWFGILALALGLLVVAAAVTVWLAPGRGPRFFAVDGALIASAALLVMMLCYLLASPSDLSSPGTGPGVWVALAGGLVATAGSIAWIRKAPCAPMHPLSLKIGRGRIFVGTVAVALILAGMFSAWSFDRRSDEERSAETKAQIEELTQRAKDNPADAGVIATEIATLSAQEILVITDGVSSKGSRLGLWTFLAGLLGLATVLPAAGVMGRDEHRRWRWSTMTAGIGSGVACAALAWILVHVRSADPKYFSGVGSFLAMLGGVLLAATAAGILKEFRRSKVYADE